MKNTKKKGIYSDGVDGRTGDHCDHCGDRSPFFYKILEDCGVSEKRIQRKDHLSCSRIKTDLLPFFRAVGEVSGTIKNEKARRRFLRTVPVSWTAESIRLRWMRTLIRKRRAEMIFCFSWSMIIAMTSRSWTGRSPSRSTVRQARSILHFLRQNARGWAMPREMPMIIWRCVTEITRAEKRGCLAIIRRKTRQMWSIWSRYVSVSRRSAFRTAKKLSLNWSSNVGNSLDVSYELTFYKKFW